MNEYISCTTKSNLEIPHKSHSIYDLQQHKHKHHHNIPRQSLDSTNNSHTQMQNQNFHNPHSNRHTSYWYHQLADHARTIRPNPATQPKLISVVSTR
ncbi:hypothetical protein ASPWEDRAFT_39866 [Aspergillus wentii DTO 134E9]|uniref:Uncharacterized protein n=1 Tax=Aspergillus wentii DTO 134E9 TaxID=1073089 RepID=A0A1L9RIN5_ASPWE|nr:uncharacterized protein ASPWEDRAFT_39866 [Aspergillus wentii DTO 134E9]OJJ34784.1 hypothetical protein ASPWEDRAFT_39866 [Aspergillus wentii DTO 134E9]